MLSSLSDTVSLSRSHSLYALTHFLIKSFFIQETLKRRNQQSLPIQLEGSDGVLKLQGTGDELQILSAFLADLRNLKPSR